ncbi:phosphohydrolase [Candidatus Magnetobacterium bavaricum]|uniref:Phosphohydrolase n=1 Tax=Candidatus Magnetobacterium bavaricum TaxID=29290 RepID=A0A0F3GKA7_9BACT|nr:phosphohydrolase [Candidatus Magnetobacterium bavaricum]
MIGLWAGRHYYELRRFGMSEITILHVSDLHMTQGHLIDIKIILRALYDDLEELRDREFVKPDIVVFTGDLVNAGSNVGEFDLAVSEFIDPLMYTLGLPRDLFFSVAGNHDIDKDKLPKFIANGIRATYNTTTDLNGFLDDLDLKSDSSYFENSYNFRILRDCLNKKHQQEANKLFSAYKVNIRGMDIGIGCLNSAWLASGSEGGFDKGKLLVGERQVDRVLDKIASCNVKIALMHHPLDWLAEFDREDVDNRLMKEFSLFLTGHMHQNKPRMIQNAIGSFFHSDGGTLFNGDRKSYQGYTIIKTGYDKIGVYFRRYIDNASRFDKDVDRAPDGYWEITFASKKSSRSVTNVAPKSFDIDTLIKSMLDDMQSQLKVSFYVSLTCANDISIRQSAIDLETSKKFNLYLKYIAETTSD